MPQNWSHRLKIDTLSGLQLFQVLRYASLFSIAVILPYAGLSKGEIGLYESFLFFAGIVTFFWITGLIQGMLPLIGEGGSKEPGARSRELFNASLLLFAFALLSGLVLWMVHPMLQRMLGQELPVELAGWIILYIILNAPSTVVEYWYMLTGRSKVLLRYGVLASLIQLLAVGLPALIWQRVDYALYGLVLAGGFRFGWMLVLLIRESVFKIDSRFILRHLKTGMPLAASVLISGSALYVDGFIVSARFDAGGFAVFRYGARELPLVALLAHALSSAMVPVFRREGIPAALRQLKERTTGMAAWMFPLTLLLILTSYLLFPLLFSRAFTESAGVFNLYLLLITSRLLFPQTVLIAIRKTPILMWASVMELILNVVLSLVLVQVWGIRGVALATVLAYYFERIFLVVYLRVNQGIPLNRYLDVRRHVIWSLILVAAYVISEWVVYPLVLNN